ncbi:hypothetical protein [Trichlorobacter lovleyi]|uniref:Big-1 domain-containing protein n=1 Tax=Trichlorobacter lovleyi (strain ATCC BAA-1151 / DSM 17278 / SZ) TaxID=398767 RepID=B3E9T5_TRIL1|nr:hypothetical protein [Trichlorobacter lovleyi]ACD95361.1 hypothetical protein Glov_1645 [Trichlorobacter lovleyi SZ]
MLKSGWRVFLSCVLLVVVTGCGGSGSGGAGADSSAGSLALVVDKIVAASGTDTVSATVTLTSLNSQPVNGVTVNVDMIYNGTVIATYSGNTNTAGVVAIPVPVGLVPADRTVYLQAKSSGITSSSSVAIAVKAPVLTVTLANASVTDVAGVTFTGAGIKFADFNGNGIANTAITFTYTSNSGSPGTLSHLGTPLAVGNSFTVTTDSTGYATIALDGVINAMPPSGSSDSTTFNYTVSVVYGTYTYTKQGSVSVTVTSS